MRIFADTAILEEIREALSYGIISGVTTNPSLMAKNSGASFKETILSIADLVPGPISAEVTAHKWEDMVDQAREIVAWSDNPEFRKRITIKVPMTPDGTRAISELSSEGIDTNCTLIFSVTQATLACEAGATYISPFVGRLDDIGHNGIGVLESILEMVQANGYDTQVIAASIRHVGHVSASAMMGCDIATVPLKVIRQLFSHPLTTAGIEKFDKDWKGFAGGR